MSKKRTPAKSKPPTINSALVIGTSLLVAVVVLLFWRGEPHGFELFLFRVLLGLAAAGLASPIPGALSIENSYVKAGGPIAIFALVVFLPAEAVLWHSPFHKEETAEMKEDLVAEVTNSKPVLVGIYPSDSFGKGQRSAVQWVGELFPNQVGVVHLELPIAQMKEGDLDPLLDQIAEVIRTRNVLAVIGPSVTETVNPVLDLLEKAGPQIPVFLLSAISAQGFSASARDQPIFRLSAGIDARAQEFSAFIENALEEGTKIHCLVEARVEPDDPEPYGEQLFDRVVDEMGESWQELRAHNQVVVGRYPHGKIEDLFPTLRESITQDEVLIHFGVGGDMARLVGTLFVRDPQAPFPRARAVGWMNAWALDSLVRERGVSWQNVFEITDGMITEQGDVLGVPGERFAAKFPVGPQSRDELYAFDSAYLAVLAYQMLESRLGTLDPGHYYELTGLLQREIVASLQGATFDLASGRVSLRNGGNAQARLVYTQFDPANERWKRASLSSLIAPPRFDQAP